MGCGEAWACALVCIVLILSITYYNLMKEDSVFDYTYCIQTCRIDKEFFQFAEYDKECLDKCNNTAIKLKEKVDRKAYK